MRLRRSPQEIHFRLQQELQNLRLAAVPPNFPAVPQAPLWPDPEAAFRALHGSSFAQTLDGLARAIMQHQFPMLGGSLETGPEIAWRKDYLHGQESAIKYFRLIPYLNFSAIGDHKLVWELSRHQHLVVLAQAYRLTRRSEHLSEIMRQLESWWVQNPFQRSIHWCSALEVAFRAWSWTWLDLFIGKEFPSEFRQRFLHSLALHGCHLERNLSVYFSPNTHLLGEAMVLHALACLYPQWPRAQTWRTLGGSWVRNELSRQVQADGAHFEQSAYYHVYALDMFLAHFLLAGRPAEFRPSLISMAEFLDHLLGPRRSIPLFGDDDGGRLFHPYGTRAEFGCATLATCAALFDRPEWLRDAADLSEQALWWLGESALRAAPPNTPAHNSRLFPASGVTVLRAGGTQVLFDTGPLGPGGAGHSHADSLQILVRNATEDLLLDPGTYTYVSDPQVRDQFRGTAAHNTIQLDNLDQATPAGPFRWTNKPEVERTRFESSPEMDFVEACCRYRNFQHRRRLLWLKPDLLVIFDDVSGPPGEHQIHLSWHCGETVAAAGEQFRLGSGAWLWSSLPLQVSQGWRSDVFGQREPAPILQSELHDSCPQVVATVLQFRSSPEPPALDPKTLFLQVGGYSLRFPLEGGIERQ